MNKCRVPGCNGLLIKDPHGHRRYTIRGLCIKHYNRWLNHGDINKVDYRSRTGYTRHPLYRTHCNILRRCYNPNNRDWAMFGGAGIRVCGRWLGVDGFTNFASDMGERPKGFILARKDKGKGFSPGNCIWVKRDYRAQQ